MNGVPVVPLYDTPLSGLNRLLKRAEDIVLATLILLLISPVLCCIALAVKPVHQGRLFSARLATAWMASRSKCGSSVP
ncbi:hypothetical protein ACLK1X_11640 [Escherichia coli]